MVEHAAPSGVVNPEVESNDDGFELVTCQVHNIAQRTPFDTSAHPVAELFDGDFCRARTDPSSSCHASCKRGVRLRAAVGPWIALRLDTW